MGTSRYTHGAIGYQQVHFGIKQGAQWFLPCILRGHYRGGLLGKGTICAWAFDVLFTVHM